MNTGTGAGSQAGKQKRQGPTRTDPVRADSCLSGFWSMPCDSIPAALSQRFLHSAAFPQRPDHRWFASLDCLRVSADSPVGKKSRTEGGPRYFRQRRKLQQAGGGCKEPRRRGPGPPCAQASADFRRDQRRRSGLFLFISAAVLRLWQWWHRLCRLLASVNTAQSPLWSRMWSTSVALVRMPC